MTPEQRLTATIAAIRPLDGPAMAAARERQAQLIKPPGSLGRLEALSIQLAGITGQVCPRLDRPAVVVMAGDHGVVAEGVSAYPPQVTPQMVRAVLAGQAAISVLARQAGASLTVVDLGVAAVLPGHPRLLDRKVRPGTRNLAHGPALTRAEALEALAAGIEVAAAERAAGRDVLILGELGIGNTTAAAALTAALTGAAPAATTGRGTGLDAHGLARKVAVVERALTVNRPDRSEPLATLAAVGGLEIAGLCGLIFGAAAHRLPLLLDGYITAAAALVAVGLCPAVRDYLLASHRSAEPGHQLALTALGLEPLLDLGMRLGEGTGAILALPLLQAAVATLRDMATFDEAGVTGSK